MAETFVSRPYDHSSITLLLFARRTEEGAVRATEQMASAMIYLMTLGIWGSSFLSPQTLIPVKSGREVLLVLAARPLFAALQAFLGISP